MKLLFKYPLTLAVVFMALGQMVSVSRIREEE
jgi:hypothetical protein